MSEHESETTDHDQDRDAASRPTGAAGSDDDQPDQDAEPASEPTG